MEIRKASTNKKKAESGKDDTPSNKIAALEAQIKQQVLQISTLMSSANNNTGIIIHQHQIIINFNHLLVLVKEVHQENDIR